MDRFESSTISTPDVALYFGKRKGPFSIEFGAMASQEIEISLLSLAPGMSRPLHHEKFSMLNTFTQVNYFIPITKHCEFFIGSGISYFETTYRSTGNPENFSGSLAYKSQDIPNQSYEFNPKISSGLQFDLSNRYRVRTAIHHQMNTHKFFSSFTSFHIDLMYCM